MSTKRLNINIDDDLRKRFKLYVLERNTTVTDEIIRYIKDCLGEPSGAQYEDTLAAKLRDTNNRESGGR